MFARPRYTPHSTRRAGSSTCPAYSVCQFPAWQRLLRPEMAAAAFRPFAPGALRGMQLRALRAVGRMHDLRLHALTMRPSILRSSVDPGGAWIQV
eukprot:4949229-Prymnesium_polylepis.1